MAQQVAIVVWLRGGIGCAVCVVGGQQLSHIDLACSKCKEVSEGERG